MLHNFAACKNIWIYDYNVKVPEAATHYDLMEGDAILIDGTPHAPTECIILRNYPNEPDYSYWGGEVVEIPEVEPYGGDVSINFYDFEFVQPEFPEENQRKFVPVKPDKKTLQGMGYILTTPEVNASGGANPVYLVKRPGSSEENDWCVMMPNIGNTDLRRKREENPRAFSIQLDVARSAEATTKLVTEFEYSATAVAQGNIALNNSEGTPFLTIDMGETKATVNGSELYDYITAGGNDGFVKVQIVIDRTAKTADIYIDGEQKITGAALSADFTDLHSITFTQSAEDKTKQMGDVYVDNVKIYEADSVDTSAPVDPAPAKVYKVNENFNRFAASGSTQALNGADSGSVPINAWWHVDGAGYRSCEFIADTEDASNKFMALNPERLEGQKSIGNIWLRFPSIPFLIGDHFDQRLRTFGSNKQQCSSI